MKPFVFAFCLFYIACCIHDTFGQQERKTVQAIPTQKQTEEKKPAAPAQKAPAKTPAKSEAKAPRIYVIQSGDNPWTIAQKHGIEVDALMKVNDIKDPKNLKIGDQLKLPEGVESKNAPAPKTEPAVAKKEEKPAPQSGDGWEMYTIKKGDNPWKISKALQVDHQKIIQLNEGLDFTKLDIGQQIKIPKKK